MFYNVYPQYLDFYTISSYWGGNLGNYNVNFQNKAILPAYLLCDLCHLAEKHNEQRLTLPTSSVLVGIPQTVLREVCPVTGTSHFWS